MEKEQLREIMDLTKDIYSKQELNSIYTPNERAVIYLRYHEGKSIKEIFTQLGCSQTYIRKVLKNINDKKHYISPAIAINLDNNDDIEVSRDLISISRGKSEKFKNINNEQLIILYKNNSFNNFYKVNNIYISNNGEVFIKLKEISNSESKLIDLTAIGEWKIKTLQVLLLNLTIKNIEQICSKF